MKKVIIVDDEASGRQLLKEYLTGYPYLVLIGEANNGVDAIKLINEFKPDLVFIDVQMPGLNGFEVLDYLEEFPIIIFSTAYDQYALKAFDANATDYLLKPYTKERFATAISKVNFDERNNVLALAEDIRLSKHQYPERIIVEKGKRYINLSISSIEYIEAFGDYSKIYAQNTSYISNNGLGELEKRLDPSLFIRVHRSHVVHWPSVHEIEKLGKSYVLHLNNGERIRVSRNYSIKIKNKMI